MVCDNCNCWFREESLHSTSKPFCAEECLYCQLDFKDYLKAHKHMERAHEFCSECNVWVEDARQLYEHYFLEHPYPGSLEDETSKKFLLSLRRDNCEGVMRINRQRHRAKAVEIERPNSVHRKEYRHRNFWAKEKGLLARFKTMLDSFRHTPGVFQSGL